MGSLGELGGGLSTYHLPEEPRLLHALRLWVRLAMLAVASFFLLMFLSQQAHAADGGSGAASSRASASTDASPSTDEPPVDAGSTSNGGKSDTTAATGSSGATAGSGSGAEIGRASCRERV